MKVSAQYAEEHFADLALAASNGEEVEIEVYGQPPLVLHQRRTLVPFKRTKPRIQGEGIGEMAVPEWDEWESINRELERKATGETTWTTPERPRAELFGSLKGKIELADDWDSPETNKEIEDLFENSELFPETPHP